MPLLRPRFTYANVLATLALVLALGGTSYAAAKLTGAQIRDGSLTGRDVRDGSLRRGDAAVGAFETPQGAAVRIASFTPGGILGGTLASVSLDDDAVTKSKVADNAVGGSEIAGGAVEGDEVANSSLTGADVRDGALSSADLAVTAAVRVEGHAATGVLTGGTASAVAWSNEIYDTSGLVALGTDATKVAVSAAGVYRIASGFDWSNADAGGSRHVGIWIDRAAAADGYAANVEQVAATSLVQVVSTSVALQAGDVVQVRVLETGGADPFSVASDAGPENFLTVDWVTRL